MSLTEQDLYPVDNDAMADSLAKIRNITVSILENVDDAEEMGSECIFLFS